MICFLYKEHIRVSTHFQNVICPMNLSKPSFGADIQRHKIFCSSFERLDIRKAYVF
jgi:hypothetical protein